MSQPIDDIITWSDQKLQPWQQDALRRFACGAVVKKDEDELLAMIRQKAGLAVSSKPPAPVPLAKPHFAGAVGGAPLKLVGVREVENVNRLKCSARIDFAPDGLTVVYGRNGSGKSGFVRILRTACRTRIEKADKLKVLANVYGASGGPQGAQIVIDTGTGEVPIVWTSSGAPAPELLHVAVFDSAAASLYVDQGHQIRFLPFGLALPHKLNELCIAFKAVLESERAVVAQKLFLAVVQFDAERNTQAQTFYKGLTATSTDAAIEAAAKFTAEDGARLTEIQAQLAAAPELSADLAALATTCASWAEACATLADAFGDDAITAAATLAQDARDKRQAANLGAAGLFSNEPLPGVGAGAWRALWSAARDYSISEAYPERPFPVVEVEGDSGACVLCQQPLDGPATDRMQRFAAYMDGAVTSAANLAEAAVAEALEKLPSLGLLEGPDWPQRLEQVEVRDEALATKLKDFKAATLARRDRIRALLTGVTPEDELAAALVSPSKELAALASKLSADAEARAKAGDDAVRAQLQTELEELTDRKTLAANVAQVKARRDLLKTDAAYGSALKEVQTNSITTAANRFVDDHLTQKVIEQFEAERKVLEIDHLKISLARKSGQTKATFQTDPGTTYTKNVSDILSEGEQRALALSAFLTEVAMTDGSGPIVIDDPVSSMDRERCRNVALRLVGEAQKRQVIVFTHDLIFFNDLCAEAEAASVPLHPVALFADQMEAGKVDPAGIVWKGLPVKKRLGLIKGEFPSVRSLHTSSPADYEYRIKGLYGRLRDTYERVVEECIFYGVITRGADRVETMKLRYVHLTDQLAVRFHKGMTKANTFSHDNPSAETVKTPGPDEFEADLGELEQLIKDVKTECDQAEARRPSMKA